MKIVTLYEANDGMLFNTEEECRKHESESEVFLSTHYLGTLVGLPARSINFRLALHGFQARNLHDEWELTKEGKKYGKDVNGELFWKRSVIGQMTKPC